MHTKKILELLNKYSYFHDTILQSISINNSSFINENRNIIFQKQGFNTVELILSSQLVFPKIRIILNKVKRMNLTEFYDFIIFECAVKKSQQGFIFSLTGTFNDGGIWFEAEDFEVEEIK